MHHLFLLHAQTADDARYFLTFYDPELGVPLPERTYAEECNIYTPGHPDGNFAHIMDKMDVFVPCHLFGWYVKVNNCNSNNYKERWNVASRYYGCVA